MVPELRQGQKVYYCDLFNKEFYMEVNETPFTRRNVDMPTALWTDELCAVVVTVPA
jgi:hypothetical protein